MDERSLTADEENLRTLAKILAFRNYTGVCERARYDNIVLRGGRLDSLVSEKKLDDMVLIAMKSIEFLEASKEYRGEAPRWYRNLWEIHEEFYWAFFMTDLRWILREYHCYFWETLPIFLPLNNYFFSRSSSRHPRVHRRFLKHFEPSIICYMEILAVSVGEYMENAFCKEEWTIHRNGCDSLDTVFWKIDAMEEFGRLLNWQDEDFARFIHRRLKCMINFMLCESATRASRSFRKLLKEEPESPSVWCYVSPKLAVIINVVLLSWSRAKELLADSNLICKRKIESRFLKAEKKMKQRYYYHTALDEGVFEKILKNLEKEFYEKLISVLDNLLSELSRSERRSLMQALLRVPKRPSIASSYFYSTSLEHCYTSFNKNTSLRISVIITDKDWVNRFFKRWYSGQMRAIHIWLEQHSDQILTSPQLNCLLCVVREVYNTFSLLQLDENVLNCEDYRKVMKRLNAEDELRSQPLQANSGTVCRNMSDASRSFFSGFGQRVLSIFSR